MFQKFIKLAIKTRLRTKSLGLGETRINKNDVKSFHLDRENIEYFKIQILGLSGEIANIWIN